MVLCSTLPLYNKDFFSLFLSCNKGGRFSARYVLKAHAAELTKAQQLSQRCQEALSCVLLAWVVPGRWHSVAPQLRGSCGSWAAARQGGEARVAKANRGSVDMKQFDSVRVVGQCRPGAPHPSCWSVNGAGTVLVFAPAGVTNASGLPMQWARRGRRAGGSGLRVATGSDAGAIPPARSGGKHGTNCQTPPFC